MGGGVWLEALTGKGLTGMKVSTQRKYACVVRGDLRYFMRITQYCGLHFKNMFVCFGKVLLLELV